MKALSLLVLFSAATLGMGKQKEALNRKTVPFWLQDETDGFCLGPDGFGNCDIGSIWVLAQTHPTKTDRTVIVSLLAPEANRMCMSSSGGGVFSSRRSLGVSKCSRNGSKKLGFTEAAKKGYAAGGYLLMQKGKDCLLRGQGRLHNSADMQQCTRGSPLALRETTIHSWGMQIVTLDGYCFDGSRFRPCSDADVALRWGVGFDFRRSEPSRNFFAFYDQDKCIVRDGEKVLKADCRSSGAKNWGWKSGRLSQGGNYCLGRRKDNSAVVVPCVEGFEYVLFITPDVAITDVSGGKAQGSSSGQRRQGYSGSSREL